MQTVFKLQVKPGTLLFTRTIAVVSIVISCFLVTITISQFAFLGVYRNEMADLIVAGILIALGLFICADLWPILCFLRRLSAEVHLSELELNRKRRASLCFVILPGGYKLDGHLGVDPRYLVRIEQERYDV